MSIQNLLNTLRSLSDIHEELLQLAQEKQQLVIENRVEQLIAVTGKETKAIGTLERLNKDVSKYTTESLAELGLSSKAGATLVDVIQAMYRADLKAEMLDVAERLRDQVRQLKELNERNQLLVRQSLDYIGFQIELLTAPHDDVTYSPIHKAKAGTPRRTFDSRA
ncbi:hypothetical protein SD71_06750 [Cohnella kolymensis]|uniref:Flagellar biosynthesis protein FlgN n=1 Tax=Cohnella kolymensis TaxID=1590652 RepID=A0ABR5A7P7_9BACL|nr:flagellar protein FlgN [Cohnella kolymensis]KIL36693.1 hypothetical protein SD71_06750 [Cohnella kolymensis]